MKENVSGCFFSEHSVYICNFLLVIDSNFGHISYRFRDIDA